MPQWRKLHTKTVESLDVNDMPDDFTRLMWVLLPLKLCREGRGLDMATWIKSQVFPLRSDVTLEMIECAMDWFEGRGMVERYVVDGRPYFQIANWEKYQGNTSREAESPYPPPTDAERENESRPTHELVASKSSTDADADADAEQPRAHAGEVYTAYQNAFGTYGAHMADVIGDEIDEHGEEWVIDAIHEAAENNAKSFRYVQKILERWASEGRRSRASPNGQGNATEEAWSVVESALGRGHPQPIMDRPDVLAAVNACGRWPAFRDCRSDQLTWKRKEFVEAYNAQR